jgi:hypothetical protein
MDRSRTAWKGLHALILVNFAVELAYAAYMIFWGSTPEARGPLGHRARAIPADRLLVRRAYATEFWVACSGLAIYLAITEIVPRIKGRGNPP